MKSGHIQNKRDQCYLGCESPRGFFLRFQAQCELRGLDKRVMILCSLENDIIKWENKLDQRTGTAYDALLEAKARQNGLSVNDIKGELHIVRDKGVPSRGLGKRGGRNVRRNGAVWPTIEKGKK